MPRLPKHWALRTLLALAGIGVALVTFALVDGWAAFGRGATGDRRTRMEASPQWDGEHFENPQPLWNDMTLWVTEAWSSQAQVVPNGPLPVVRGGATRFQTAPASGLRVTWLGHSSLLIEIDGHRILTDPVWGERASPLDWIGPARWYDPPLPLEDLPPLDVVVISHDHYDHLDYPTVTALAGRDVPFLVPLGVGAHLEYWGIPTERIVELDWWEHTEIADLTITCTPARHASGRGVFDQNATLWAGWAMAGPAHRAFFSGDTGLFPAIREIGDRLGPFDVTMIEVGAYGAGWPDWHIGPEQAAKAHQWLRGDVMIPIHWGLFNLALHAWTEPAERVVVAAQTRGITLVVPRPGQSIEPADPPPLERWWPRIPWQTADEYPIVSTAIPAD